MWSLPGPAQFAATARTRLADGYSVFAGLPGAIVADDGFRVGLLDAIDFRCQEIGDCAGTDRPLPSVVAERFGIDDIEPGPDAAAMLARHDTMLERSLVVTVSDKPDHIARWADFALGFTAAARVMPAGSRPRLLILGGHACAAALDGAQLIEHLWWWGVLDRLDTASFVQRRLTSLVRDDLRRDTIAEIAGFDLELADYLVAEWDGDERTLPAALAGFTGPGWPAVRIPRGLPASSTALGAPPAAMLPMWDQGLADAWDAFAVYLHPCSAPADVLRARIWRAQVRCLMPLIDEERARIAAWLRRDVRALRDDEMLEPGDLYAVMQASPALKSWRGGYRYRLVRWLRDARNRLAHLSVLTPEEISQGRRLIQADREHS